ncbi:MAG: hypothetical protein ACJ734_10960 [Gaiellaceae bacterium]
MRPHVASEHHDDECDSCACDNFEALEPIGFDECRHSYSSFLDAAGISEVRADRYMGHSNYSMRARAETRDRKACAETLAGMPLFA